MLSSMQVCALIVQLAVLLYMVFMASTPRPKPQLRARNSMGLLPYDADYFHLIYALASMFVGCMVSSTRHHGHSHLQTCVVQPASYTT